MRTHVRACTRMSRETARWRKWGSRLMVFLQQEGWSKLGLPLVPLNTPLGAHFTNSQGLFFYDPQAAVTGTKYPLL